MAETRKEWTYFDEEIGDWVRPFLTLQELDVRRSTNAIGDHTMCVNDSMARQGGGIPTPGIPYSKISRVGIIFIPDSDEFWRERSETPTTILSGPNNGGKSLLLKYMFRKVGHGGYLIGCNRFSHVDLLNSRQQDEHEHRRYYDTFIQQFERSNQNTEDNNLRLDQILTGLKDYQRIKLFDTAEALIGNKFEMVRTDKDNQFSPFHVLMDGENLRYGSSGTRLVLTILGILLDERFSTILIDEPEIGLSPRIQVRLARFLYDPTERKAFCPHIKQIFVATHSHIFLDRSIYANNFIVSKQGSAVSVRQLQTANDLHSLQFNMLGNDLELLYLPAAIVMVEGDTDALFCQKLAGFRLPGRRVAFVPANGEGEVPKMLHFFKESFGDLFSSPYRSRLFILYDKAISTSLAKIERSGVLRDNIVLLTMNGIEHYYPKDLVARAFRCSESELPNISLSKDPIVYNDHRYSKKQLAQFVVDNLSDTHVLDPEIESLLTKIVSACG